MISNAPGLLQNIPVTVAQSILPDDFYKKVVSLI